MKKILIFLITFSFVALYANAETLHDNIECNSSSIFEQNKLLKKELENGDITYTSKALNVKMHLHPYISDTDKAYVDYIFLTNQHNLGNIRFYDTDNFVDFGDILFFKHLNQNNYAIIKYYPEGEKTYYFIVELDNKKIKNIYHSYYKLSRYIPKKLLMQEKYVPITYTMYEKDGGLYLKVGSTYKSDVITLKKPTSGK